MQLDHRRRIRNVMLYLDNNLDRFVSIGALARIACFSPFHFQRIFQTVTGETVLQYQQRKRLELAVQLLRESSRSIIDIALSIGYQTPTSFNKAFKKWIGTTPTSFRQQSDLRPLSSFEPLLQTGNVKKSVYPHRIDDLPEMQFAFIETQGLWKGSFVKAGQPAFKKAYEIIRRQGLNVNGNHWIGMIPFKPERYTDAMARFRFGILFNQQIDVQQPLSTMKVAAGRVAIFEHRGPYEYLLQTWALAYNGWLPRSNEILRDMAPYEIYMNNPWNTPPEQWVTRVCVPIV